MLVFEISGGLVENGDKKNMRTFVLLEDRCAES